MRIKTERCAIRSRRNPITGECVPNKCSNNSTPKCRSATKVYKESDFNGNRCPKKSRRRCSSLKNALKKSRRRYSARNHKLMKKLLGRSFGKREKDTRNNQLMKQLLGPKLRKREKDARNNQLMDKLLG
jgi:hypothetical protein